MIEDICNFSNTNNIIYPTVTISVINSSENANIPEGTSYSDSLKKLKVIDEEKSFDILNTPLNLVLLKNIKSDVSYTIDLYNKEESEILEYLKTLSNIVIDSCNIYNLNIYILTVSSEEKDTETSQDVSIKVKDVENTGVEHSKLRDSSEQSAEKDQFAVDHEDKLSVLAEAHPKPKLNQSSLFKCKFNIMIDSLPVKIYNNIIIINFSGVQVNHFDFLNKYEYADLLDFEFSKDNYTELNKHFIFNVLQNNKQKKFLKVINFTNFNSDIKQPGADKSYLYTISQIDNAENIINTIKQLIEERRCSYGKLIQFTGTCWINSVLNGLMLSSTTRNLMILKTQELIDAEEERLTTDSALNKYKCTVDHIMKYGNEEEVIEVPTAVSINDKYKINELYLSTEQIISSIIFNFFINKLHIYTGVDFNFLSILERKINKERTYMFASSNIEAEVWGNEWYYLSKPIVPDDDLESLYDTDDTSESGNTSEPDETNKAVETNKTDETDETDEGGGPNYFLWFIFNDYLKIEYSSYRICYVYSELGYLDMLTTYFKTNYTLQFGLITGLDHVILQFDCNKNFYIYDSNEKSAVKIKNIFDSYKFFKSYISNNKSKREYLDMKRGKIENYFVFMDINEIIKKQPYSLLNKKHIEPDSPIDLEIEDDPLPSKPTEELKTKRENLRKTLNKQKSISTVSRDVDSITRPTELKISTTDINKPLSCSQSFYNFICRLTKYNKRSRIGVAGGYSLILSKVYSKKKNNNKNKYLKVKRRNVKNIGGGTAKVKSNFFGTSVKKCRKNVNLPSQARANWSSSTLRSGENVNSTLRSKKSINFKKTKKNVLFLSKHIKRPSFRKQKRS